MATTEKGERDLPAQSAKFPGGLKFSAAVGNPPYQMPAGDSTTHVHSVFHHYQEVAMVVSSSTCMVYPGGRWMQRGGKNLKEFGAAFMNDPHLLAIYYYPSVKGAEIFPSVDIQDGVSITLWHRGKTAEKLLLNGESVARPGRGILPLDVALLSTLAKVQSTADKFGWQPLGERVGKRGLFGVESPFIERNPDLALPIEKSEEAQAKFPHPVKLLTNDKAGKAGRAKWFWVDRSSIPKGQAFIEKWQFVIRSAQFANQGGYMAKGMVIDNNSAFGRSKIALISLDTREEAENFQRLMNTALFTALFQQSQASGLSHICSFMPDLGDYTDGNPLFQSDEALGEGHEYHGLPLEQRVQKLFALGEKEIAALRA